MTHEIKRSCQIKIKDHTLNDNKIKNQKKKGHIALDDSIRNVLSRQKLPKLSLHIDSEGVNKPLMHF